MVCAYPNCGSQGGFIEGATQERFMVNLSHIIGAYRTGREHAAGCVRSGAGWWLEELELPTEQAEAEAAQALRSAEQGNLFQALTHAEAACALESVEYHDCPTWQPLRRAIMTTIEEAKS